MIGVVSQLHTIKRTLEEVSGVHDIGIRKRVRFNSDLKKTYFKLASELTKSGLSLMGQILGNYDHATALHNRRQFDNLYESESFTCNVIYEEVKETLLKSKEFKNGIKPLTIRDLKRIQHLKIIAFINQNKKVIKLVTRLRTENRILKKEIETLKVLTEE